MPPLKPKFININGEKEELFYIGELANSLGRTTQTVRKWEIGGIIPKTIFKDKSSRRMYTQGQIDIIVQIAEDCSIMQGQSIGNTLFSARVHKALAEYNKRYFKEEKK